MLEEILKRKFRRNRRELRYANYCLEITSAPNFSIAAICSLVVAAGPMIILDIPIDANFSISPGEACRICGAIFARAWNASRGMRR